MQSFEQTPDFDASGLPCGTGNPPDVVTALETATVEPSEPAPALDTNSGASPPGLLTRIKAKVVRAVAGDDYAAASLSHLDRTLPEIWRCPVIGKDEPKNAPILTPNFDFAAAYKASCRQYPIPEKPTGRWEKEFDEWLATCGPQPQNDPLSTFRSEREVFDQGAAEAYVGDFGGHQDVALARFPLARPFTHTRWNRGSADRLEAGVEAVKAREKKQQDHAIELARRAALPVPIGSRVGYAVPRAHLHTTEWCQFFTTGPERGAPFKYTQINEAGEAVYVFCDMPELLKNIPLPGARRMKAEETIPPGAPVFACSGNLMGWILRNQADTGPVRPGGWVNDDYATFKARQLPNIALYYGGGYNDFTGIKGLTQTLEIQAECRGRLTSPDVAGVYFDRLVNEWHAAQPNTSRFETHDEPDEIIDNGPGIMKSTKLGKRVRQKVLLPLPAGTIIKSDVVLACLKYAREGFIKPGSLVSELEDECTVGEEMDPWAPTLLAFAETIGGSGGFTTGDCVTVLQRAGFEVDPVHTKTYKRFLSILRPHGYEKVQERDPFGELVRVYRRKAV
jgi:hypothetical protein